MTFKEATDRLTKAGISLREIGEAIGSSHQYVRAMVLAPGTKGARPPPSPEKWRAPLVALARARIDALEGFVRDAEK